MALPGVMTEVQFDRLVSRGVAIQMAAVWLRNGKEPLKVAEFLEHHDRRLYDVPENKLPLFVSKLTKEVGL